MVFWITLLFKLTTMNSGKHPSNWDFDCACLAHVTTICYEKQRFFEDLEVVKIVKEKFQSGASNKGINLLKVGVDFDHMHCLICLNPGEKVSNIMGYLKGLSSFNLRENIKHLKEYPSFWGKGVDVRYYPLSMDKVIVDYIHNQEQEKMMRSGEDWPWI